MKKIIIVLGIVIVLLVVFLMMGPLYIVNEGTQAVVTRFGEVVNAPTKAGLYIKVPFIDIVTIYPRLILSLDGDSQRIPTKENQFIIVDTTSRWKIDDPKLFYQSFKTLDAAYNRLSDIIDSATRTVITQNRLSEVVRTSNIINQRNNETSLVTFDDNQVAEQDLSTNLVTYEEVSKGRRQLSLEMAEQAREMVKEYGIELIDIVPRQIKYSDEMTESVYKRMIKDRNQIAQHYRALGEGKKAEWLGRLEHEKRSIESEAYKKAEEIKGQADAEATKIYAESYAKDPEFYSFWKSLESYKETMPKFDTIYSTDMDYFKYLHSTRQR